jgi:N-acetylgalactosamine kinase
MSAGLSSSSALVVVTALAYLECTGKALGEDITRIELATLMADAEHYVGTRGGGMDQAIILLGDAGHACKIDFFPLRVELAPLPEGHDICACNSLVKATKTGEALHRYNEGPRTCKMLCAMIERQISKDFGMDVELNRLGDLWFGPLCLTQREIEGFVEKAFPRERTTLVEAGKALGLSEKAIRDKWLGDLREPEGGFPLRARARHQMTEYRRVESARDALQAGDAEALGALMNASHTSCANDYLVSCTELDCLVETARKCGSIGSRLTGAGFGGCTVNLVPRNRYDSFLESITTQYYEGYIPPRATVKPMPPIELARFRVTPGPGAGYVHV